MKQKSEKSQELYQILLKRGYPAPFCYHASVGNVQWTFPKGMK